MTSKNRQSGSKDSHSMLRADIPVEDESRVQISWMNRHEPRPPVEAPRRVPVQKDTANEPDLGLTIRRLRESRQLSLKEVAARSGLTQSFLSQVERNLTSPSVASLRKVALAFGVPLTALFQGPVIPENRVVRRNERKQLIHPRRQWGDYLLTPSLTGKLQVILSLIEPGGGSGDEPYAHDSDEECVIVLRGRLEFRLGSDEYKLEEGDSIVFESRIPHWNRNPGPGQAEVLWITTPPSY